MLKQNKWRVFITTTIIGGYGLSMLALGRNSIDVATVGVTTISLCLTLVAVLAISMVWSYQLQLRDPYHQGEQNQQQAQQATATVNKHKRQAIDEALRNLSDADLETLKQRLNDGVITDELLYEEMALGDDGEFIQLERKR